MTDSSTLLFIFGSSGVTMAQSVRERTVSWRVKLWGFPRAILALVLANRSYRLPGAPRLGTRG